MHTYTTGIATIGGKRVIVAVYPNPVSGIVTLEIGAAVVGGSFTLSDALGRVVYRAGVNSKLSTFNLSDLPGGLYVYRVSLGALNYMGKLSKR